MRRLIIVGAVLAGGLLVGTVTAAAHVIASQSAATRGSAAEIAFRVPDEEESAATTRVEVVFPVDHPIASVTARAIPGWHTTVAKVRLATPVDSGHGPVTEVVSTITWSGGAIAPDTFQDFAVSLDPLPSDAAPLVFKAIQTYDNGDVVRWVDTPVVDRAAPGHPAPTVTLTPADPGVRAASASWRTTLSAESDTGLGVLGVLIGIVIGLVAVALASLALWRTRGSR